MLQKMWALKEALGKINKLFNSQYKPFSLKYYIFETNTIPCKHSKWHINIINTCNVYNKDNSLWINWTNEKFIKTNLCQYFKLHGHIFNKKLENCKFDKQS